MIEIERHQLANGMQIIVHRDQSSPLAAFNLLYKVGSRNENEHRTGFAHLFEHLMFGGSRNVPDYDQVTQIIGAENNAFTTNDMTDYHLVVPSANIETVFWLESDRMNELTISDETLEVQRAVVIEEFKQRCLNQPYGDLDHLSRQLAFKVHPYRWPTIGLDIKHIAEASLAEVRNFYYNHYAPSNAILAVAGNVDPQEIFALAEKWFGPIERRPSIMPIHAEPPQTEQRISEVERDVPADTLSVMYHIGGRMSRDYYVCDIATDLLADGTSSRLVQRLAKRDHMTSDVNAFISGSVDPGLLTLTATLLPDVNIADVETAFSEELQRLIDGDISDYELRKVKNRNEATNIFGETSILAKAQNLAYYEMLGNASMINHETTIFDSVTRDEISQTLARIVVPENQSILRYRAKQ